MIMMLLKKFEAHYFFLTHTEGSRAFYEKYGFKNNGNALWIQKN